MVIGEALQSLLGMIDQAVEALGAEEVHEVISINDKYTTFTLSENSLIDSMERYPAAIAN